MEGNEREILELRYWEMPLLCKLYGSHSHGREMSGKTILQLHSLQMLRMKIPEYAE